MSKQPFLPLFFGDFLASTAEWEGEEQALYLLLLGYQWSLGSLPNDTKKLCRLVKFSERAFEQSWPIVSQKFTLDGDGRLINVRLESHRVKAIELAQKNSNSGRKGAEARWGKNGERRAEAMANAIEVNGERHQSANGVTNSNPSHPIPSHPNPIQSKNPEKDISSTASPETDGQEKAVASKAEKFVFAHWQREWDHPDAVLDPKRRARIKARLKHFTPEQLCDAISGFKHSDWHTGRDPNGGGKIFDGIQTLLRDDEQVEIGLRLFAHPPQAPPPKKILSTVERVKLANGGAKNDERVVSEQRQSRGSLDLLDGDVRQPFDAGLRRIGS